ncbi:protein of unknown function [Pararobbsia alpina]
MMRQVCCHIQGLETTRLAVPDGSKWAAHPAASEVASEARGRVAHSALDRTTARPR